MHFKKTTFPEKTGENLKSMEREQESKISKSFLSSFPFYFLYTLESFRENP